MDASRLTLDRAMAAPRFHDQVVELFGTQFPKLFRFLDRLTGDPDLAGDLAQEAFIRLFRRGSLPEAPEAWLISVALNLHRNVQATRGRRRRLLSLVRAERVQGDPPPAADLAVIAGEERQRVRAALDAIPERERRLLLLRAEGYSYRDIATVLDLNEASIGTLLARARRSFREVCGDVGDAP